VRAKNAFDAYVVKDSYSLAILYWFDIIRNFLIQVRSAVKKTYNNIE